MKKLMIMAVMAAFLATGAWAQAETRHEENVSWYRIHLGQGTGENALSGEDIAAFIDAEITPRFSQGLTVTEARGQWNSPNGLVREKTTVVDIQAPDRPEVRASVAAIAEVYLKLYKEKAGVSLFVMKVDGMSTDLYY